MSGKTTKPDNSNTISFTEKTNLICWPPLKTYSWGAIDDAEAESFLQGDSDLLQFVTTCYLLERHSFLLVYIVWP